MSARLIYAVFVSALFASGAFAAEEGPHSFGVLSQRSAVLTAQYWNPIFEHVKRKTGIALRLKIARTAPESNAAIARGEYDFVYSNTIFLPATSAPGYQVILRPRSGAITGQIVTLEDSPIRTLADLQGREAGFPSKAAFVGYAVPMDHLLRQGIQVIPVFGGNQEGIMGQLKAGKVVVAGVNNEVMRAFAARENVRYRVLWESVPYHNLPVAVHPRVPGPVAAAVQSAIADMADDPEGAAVLEASARIIGQKPPLGFLKSGPADYRNYLDFYRQTVVKDIE
ncbi:MAG: phosphate/phosphite/phosphonate ABC transporter substrate-binding protein [Candidatus Nitricoxidivorans perseverans]|uniref:Phosphate/phosphite/phosphonate ABC transporter substrate-binding protein n=1 Tax=Candidatus Nitricoxidivorans perseverans TaxID=2975601 RepID=A0AA49FKZ7_9PROT|nr:MAG: phosphate/phosphite/phosphonate ABC transporter substrate-binding protein [Candidatus Nitricoxidivorans perseverans]